MQRLARVCQQQLRYCDEYCDEHICVCVCDLCLCICLSRVYLPNNTLDLYQIFVHGACGRHGSVLLRRGDEIPSGISNFWGFLPQWQYTVQHSFRDPCKTAKPIEMPFVVMSEFGPRNSVLRGGDDPRKDGAILVENMCSKSIPDNCELGWSLQRHTTWADAGLQALDKSII